MRKISLIKRIALIGGLTIAIALILGYGIGVYLGEVELGVDHALIFFAYAMITIVPLVLILGALPFLVSAIALGKKKKRVQTSQDD